MAKIVLENVGILCFSQSLKASSMTSSLMLRFKRTSRIWAFPLSIDMLIEPSPAFFSFKSKGSVMRFALIRQ